MVLAAPDRDVAPLGCGAEQREGAAQVARRVEDAGRPLDVAHAREVVLVVVMGFLGDAAGFFWGPTRTSARRLHVLLERRRAARGRGVPREPTRASAEANSPAQRGGSSGVKSSLSRLVSARSPSTSVLL